MNESLFVECASWIYENKNGVGWWTPYVLTEHNPNSNPHINIDEAYAIFAELNRRRLMTHKMVKLDTNETIPAFEINTAKDADWQDLIKKTGFVKLTLIPTLWWLWGHIWLLLLFLLGTSITACLTTVVQDAIENPVQDVRLDPSQLESVLKALPNTEQQPPIEIAPIQEPAKQGE